MLRFSLFLVLMQCESKHADDGAEIDGLPTEGVEITCFSLVGFFYDLSQ